MRWVDSLDYSHDLSSHPHSKSNNNFFFSKRKWWFKFMELEFSLHQIQKIKLLILLVMKFKFDNEGVIHITSNRVVPERTKG